MKKLSTCVALFTVLSVLPYNIGVRGADWPQWQGPNRDGVWHEQGIVEGIPENGLPIVWRVPVGGGYSGPAVAGDHLYVADYLKSEGTVENNLTTDLFFPVLSAYFVLIQPREKKSGSTSMTALIRYRTQQGHAARLRYTTTESTHLDPREIFFALMPKTANSFGRKISKRL